MMPISDPTVMSRSHVYMNIEQPKQFSVPSGPIEVTTRNPMMLECFKCNKFSMTQVLLVNGAKVMFWFWILFGIGFITVLTWFVCCIPCCIDDFKKCEHHCPHCNTIVATQGKLLNTLNKQINQKWSSSLFS